MGHLRHVEKNPRREKKGFVKNPFLRLNAGEIFS